MRKIPATMSSQHPDNASVPFWNTSAYVGVHQEYTECYICFSELGIDEYKWDWEGKLVDESVAERLFSEHFDFFKKNQLGKDKFLTFRLPNPKVETEFRLGRAFMNILSTVGLANQVGFKNSPLFEVILPMTESDEEMLAIVEAFKELTSLNHPLLKLSPTQVSLLEIIPLFEQVSTIIHSDQILRKYIKRHQKKFKSQPVYMRPYLARSDPALNSGLIPTVLGIKIALSKYVELEKELHIKLFPIIGSASLPFRGGLTPYSVTEFMDEYKGIKTVLLQSAFKYDYPKEDVIKAIKKLKHLTKHTKTVRIPEFEIKSLEKIIPKMELLYRHTVEKMAPFINRISVFIPKRRERVQHIGLFGYSRGVGNVKLPRAIGFTAALYSIGCPPEIIGTGRSIRLLKNVGQLKNIERYYIHLKDDLSRSGKFVNKKVIEMLSKKYSFGKELMEDITAIEEYLGEELMPVTVEEKKHHKNTFLNYEKIEAGLLTPKDIEKTALLRKSIG